MELALSGSGVVNCLWISLSPAKPFTMVSSVNCANLISAEAQPDVETDFIANTNIFF